MLSSISVALLIARAVDEVAFSVLMAAILAVILSTAMDCLDFFNIVSKGLLWSIERFDLIGSVFCRQVVDVIHLWCLCLTVVGIVQMRELCLENLF